MARPSGRRRTRRPETAQPEAAVPERYAVPWLAAGLATAAVWLLYVVTLAPTTQFWDTSEYIASGHIVGIPHPPGNPLFVLIARVWELLLAPTGLSVAVRTNLLSATVSALAHGLWFLVLHRILAGTKAGRRFALVGATAGVILSATAFTVWNQSNVNEKVYTISLLTTALLSWLMLLWRDRRARPAESSAPATTGAIEWLRRPVPADRLLVLAAFLLGLTATNHTMGLLVAPAMIAFVLATRPRALANPRLWLFGGLAAVIGFSVFAFLPIRGALHPLINEGDPTTLNGFLDALQRRQYMKPPVLSDPTVPFYEGACSGLFGCAPRTASLLAAQLANWAQYFDWQWARSVAGDVSWFGGVRPLVTLVVLLLGIAGARRLWKADRAAALYLLVLFLTLSIGLTFYLNFKYGFSYPLGAAAAALPDPREVRERDYFFLIGFSLWGLFTGVGVATLWDAARDRIGERLARGAAMARAARLPHLAAAPVLAIALLPAALNWSWATRAGDFTARDWAYNMLMSADPYAVLVTNGDNDTFPLWYLQEVEGVRRDVSVVVASYLNTPWYARQVRDSTRPCPAGVDPEASPTLIVCQRPYSGDGVVAPGEPVRPPGDSVLPLTDAQIEAVAGRFTRLDRPAQLEVGDIRTTVPAGTELTPSDTFITAILAANLGRRPVQFVVPSPPLATLNLGDYTVRQGLTVRLENGPVRSGPGTGIVEIPGNPAPYTYGRYVDLDATDRLLRDTFVMRRQPEDWKVWADSATKNIAVYYAFTHAALAEAWAARGDMRKANLHADRSRAWAGLAQ